MAPNFRSGGRSAEQRKRERAVIAAWDELQQRSKPERLDKALKPDEAHAAAAAEGLVLVRLPGSKTGFKNVGSSGSGHTFPFKAFVGDGKEKISLGTYVTAEEAALAFARALGPDLNRALNEAASKVDTRSTQPMTSVEALQQAEAEGLELIRTPRSQSGFEHVAVMRGGQFAAQINNHQSDGTNKTIWLGTYASGAEAALAVARYRAKWPAAPRKRPRVDPDRTAVLTAAEAAEADESAAAFADATASSAPPMVRIYAAGGPKAVTPTPPGRAPPKSRWEAKRKLEDAWESAWEAAGGPTADDEEDHEWHAPKRAEAAGSSGGSGGGSSSHVPLSHGRSQRSAAAGAARAIAAAAAAQCEPESDEDDVPLARRGFRVTEASRGDALREVPVTVHPMSQWHDAGGLQEAVPCGEVLGVEQDEETDCEEVEPIVVECVVVSES